MTKQHIVVVDSYRQLSMATALDHSTRIAPRQMG